VTANRRIWPAAVYVLCALFIVFGWIVLSGALWPDLPAAYSTPMTG